MRCEDINRMPDEMSNSPHLPTIVGGVLLGGESRRFGGPKQLARWGDTTLAERAVAALAEIAGEVALLGAGEVPPALAGLERIEDVADVRGPIAGLIAALAAHPGRALLALACDQPLVGRAELAWLLDRRRAGVIAVVARWDEAGIEPLPGLYEPAALPLLRELAARDGSIQPLARRADVVAEHPPAALRAAWKSADTPAELAVLAAIAGSGGGG
jgi:molybdopterin-guanine dinucleotide biosynthesis protein A